MDPTRRRLLVVALAATAVTVLLGFALKAQCLPDYDRDRDRLLCSNDLQVLWGLRGMATHPFPYVHGGYVGGVLGGGAIEYPVLTGLFAWVPALLAHDAGSYLVWSAVLLAPFALVTTWLLTGMAGRRALLWALSPALVEYSFHNWDLLVVAATVAALAAARARRPGLAGALLAVGADLKLWPLLLVLPLLLDRLAERDRPGAVRAVAAAVGVLVVTNLPFVLASPGGWAAPYLFQADRAADITSNSVWYWGLPQLSTATLDLLVPVLLAALTLLACAVGWRRAAREGAFPLVPVCAAVLAAFMVTGKAHSPQYALWLLPFLVLVRLPWPWYAVYTALDVVFYVGLFTWFDHLRYGQPGGLAHTAVLVGVWGRAAALALLYVAVLRADAAGPVVAGGAVRRARAARLRPVTG